MSPVRELAPSSCHERQPAASHCHAEESVRRAASTTRPADEASETHAHKTAAITATSTPTVLPAQAGIQRPRVTPRHNLSAYATPSATRTVKDTPLGRRNGKARLIRKQRTAKHILPPPIVMLRSRSDTPRQRHAPPTKHLRRRAHKTAAITATSPPTVLPAQAGIQRPRVTPRHRPSTYATPSAKQHLRRTLLDPSLRWEDGMGRQDESASSAPQSISCRLPLSC
jgi:hypothetical protein